MDETAGDLARVDRIQAIPTILQVVCETTGMGFAALARVTDERWIACSVLDRIGFGLEPGGELKLQTTICHEIRQCGREVVIDHVAEDEHWRGHHTPAVYGFESYISVPVVLSDGAFFGTLCAIDPRPARLDTPQVRGMFKLFAELIAFHLDTQARLDRSEAALLDARETAELREQFIAVIGHDLRNPLASIDAGAQMLLKRPLDDTAVSIVGLVRNSTQRMAGLIDNILDFARGRLGGGLTLRRTTAGVGPLLKHVTAELRSAWPDRVITTEFRVEEPVSCDRGRLAQLYSNLLGNALVHGAADQPVRVAATTADGQFRLKVVNAGDPIPPEAFDQLFLPFKRGSVLPDQEGLGLGLYIASEIARAHGGRLDCTSDDDATCFSFVMPVAEAAG